MPVHLEYILTGELTSSSPLASSVPTLSHSLSKPEILKNSYRATVERHQHSKAGTPLPPVVITIAPSSLPSSPNRPSYMSLRVRDQGGGVSPSNMQRIFSYAFTTAGSSSSSSNADGDDGMDGGPYAAQHVGGAAAIDGGSGSSSDGGGNLFGEITGKGLQTGLGTIAGLGYG